MRLRHVAPVSLARYAQHLDAAFAAVGVSVVADADAVLVEIHASAHETLVAPVRGAPLVVLVHRPQEWLLRYSHAQRAAQLGDARVLVVLGAAWVPQLRLHYPALRVEAIPHGFFSVGDGGAAILEPCVVGSVTTWGDMRYVADAAALARAVTQRAPQVLAYLGGAFDTHNRAYVEAHGDTFVVLSPVHAAAGAALADEGQWRQWLLGLAGTAQRVVVNLDNVWAAHSVHAQWEARLVLFNVQLYREVLLEHGPPKVEYSGTAHLRADMINVVFDCPAMCDLRDAEALHLVFCRADPHTGALDCDDAAARVAALCGDADTRQQLVRANMAAAGRLGMTEVAARYRAVFESLGHQ